MPSTSPQNIGRDRHLAMLDAALQRKLPLWRSPTVKEIDDANRAYDQRHGFPEHPKCVRCGTRLDPVLAAAGEVEHNLCY